MANAAKLEQDAKAIFKAIQQGNLELAVKHLINLNLALLLCFNLKTLMFSLDGAFSFTHTDSSKEARSF